MEHDGCPVQNGVMAILDEEIERDWFIAGTEIQWPSS